MDQTAKLALIEEAMELDEGTLKPTDVLETLDNWDSVARLSVIVMMDDTFGKKLSGPQIREFRTVQDILNFME